MIMPENGSFSNDMPDHQVGDTSSIGGVGEPVASSWERYKGFYRDGVVNNNTHLSNFLSQFETAKMRLVSEYTRVQHRAVFEAETLAQHRNELMPVVEAIIPIGGNFGRNPLLVYASYNKPVRLPDDNDFIRVQQNIQKALNASPRNIAELLGKTHGNGHRIVILDNLLRRDRGVVSQVYGLYERFGWGEQEVTGMLGNEDNIIAVAIKGNEIVSAGMGELARIPVGDKSLRIMEVTEAATHWNYQGQGLYTGVSTALLLEAKNRSRHRQIFGGELDLVFGECNGLALGVLLVAAHQGRLFAPVVGEALGFPNTGILKQQVPISGAERNTPYNDLVVTGLTRKALYGLK